MNETCLKIRSGSNSNSPQVIAMGSLDADQMPTLEDVVETFLELGISGLAIDISNARFSDVEGVSSVIRMLRKASQAVGVTVTADEKITQLLTKSGFDGNVVLHVASEAQGETGAEYLTSRWMASTAEEDNLPKAA